MFAYSVLRFHAYTWRNTQTLHVKLCTTNTLVHSVPNIFICQRLDIQRNCNISGFCFRTGAMYTGGNYAHNGPVHRILVISEITVGLLLYQLPNKWFIWRRSMNQASSPLRPLRPVKERTGERTLQPQSIFRVLSPSRNSLLFDIRRNNCACRPI